MTPLRFAFTDYETTGLRAARHEPIELACVITDERFHEVDSFVTLIKPTANPSDWDPAAWSMHHVSGLARDAIERGLPLPFVHGAFTVFLQKNSGGCSLRLAGNSVHFDRGFMAHHMPEAEALFHHRHLDVSSIRTLGECVTESAGLGGPPPHRAMADVRRSIAEAEHWAREISKGLRPGLWR